MASKKVTTKVSEAQNDSDKLTAQEEKVLDWILNGIVVFVLGWLALGVLLSLGGLLGIWK